MNAATMSNNFDFSKAVRLFVLMALLVGSLQVSRCSNDDDDWGARDQYDRMHKITLAGN